MRQVRLMPLASAFGLLASVSLSDPRMTNAGPTYAQRDWLDSLPDPDEEVHNG